MKLCVKQSIVIKAGTRTAHCTYSASMNTCQCTGLFEPTQRTILDPTCQGAAYKLLSTATSMLAKWRIRAGVFYIMLGTKGQHRLEPVHHNRHYNSKCFYSYFALCVVTATQVDPRMKMK